jgi:sugar phosphate isomerase/epimerase
MSRDYNPRVKSLSRREFGTAVAATLPLMRSRTLPGAPLLVGVSTASFRDLRRVPGRDNLDDVIHAVQAVRATHIELAFANLEPAPPSTAPVMGGSAAYPRRVVLSPEEVVALNADARMSLRDWRCKTAPVAFGDARRKLTEAGFTVHACALSYDDSFTDDEIHATFQQAGALGVKTISSPLTMAMAERLVPFAERYDIGVAIHPQGIGSAAARLDMLHLDRALALSPLFRVKLDVGALTAANRDAAADLRAYEARVACVVVNDRLRNGGASQPLGEGDAPIRAVIGVLKESSRSIPALVHYDYVGLRTPVAEVTAALEYLNASR